MAEIEEHLRSQALDLAEMMRAHEFHQPNPRDRALASCKGIRDPETGFHCQFQGTPQEQYQHLQERLLAVLEGFQVIEWQVEIRWRDQEFAGAKGPTTRLEEMSSMDHVEALIEAYRRDREVVAYQVHQRTAAFSPWEPVGEEHWFTIEEREEAYARLFGEMGVPYIKEPE